MDLNVGIIGWGDISYENAARLLDDYLPPEPDIYVGVEMLEKQPGVSQVISWMTKVNQEFQTSSNVTLDIMSAPGDDAVLIVVGTDYLEAEMKFALEKEIPVLDLTKALFPVTSVGGAKTGMPLYEPESNAETSPEDSGTGARAGIPEAYDPSQPPTLKIVENMIKEAIMQHEATYHERAYIDGVPWKPVEAPVVSEIHQEPDISETETYYFDEAKNTYRKKGRRKIKPGEVEVMLTQKEISELPAE